MNKKIAITTGLLVIIGLIIIGVTFFNNKEVESLETPENIMQDTNRLDSENPEVVNDYSKNVTESQNQETNLPPQNNQADQNMPPIDNEQSREFAPQEAITACIDGTIDSSCSFTTLNETISGTCQTIDNEELVCVPVNAPVE